MNNTQFEDLDAIAGERAESASFEEIALGQPNLLAIMRDDAEGLCLQTAILRSGVRQMVARILRHVSPEIRVLSSEDANVLVSQVQAMELASHNLNAVARAILALAEDAAMPSPDVPEGAAPEIEIQAPAKAPKVELSPACQSLRRQFFGAARKMGLSSRPEKRAARIAAVSVLVNRPLLSINELEESEWLAAVYAVEDGRLQW